MPRGRRAASPVSDEDFDRRPPALTPEARENQIIAAAYDLAEKRIRDGSASAMEVTYFLKLGSAREKEERRLLAERTRLATAKAEAIDRGREQEQMYTDAINAMRRYSGHGDEEFYDDY